MDIPYINSETIILTFTDYKYLPIFNIWYNYFEKLNLQNLLVISLDDITFTNLNSRKINTILCNYNIVNRDKFWQFRLKTIFNIFKQSKKNIIHTDSDCIWLKDVYSLINNEPYDIIASIESGHPVELSKKYGFIMCCGFYYVKYNEIMIKMFENIIGQDGHGTDDQVLFNYYMFDNSTDIISNPNELIEKEVQLKDNIKIVLLKRSIIDRYDCTKDTYCFHPWLSKSSIIDKINQLRGLMKDLAIF